MRGDGLASAARPLPGGWRVVILLWFVACFNFMARYMIATMHTSILEAIPMSDAQFGLLLSVFLWGYGLMSPWAGFLSDRFSRSRVITISMIAWSAVTLLTGYARTFEQLLAMRVAMAFCEATYMPAALALISEYHRGATRALATGLHMSAAVFGVALSGTGGMLAEWQSWHFAFTMVGALGVAYGVILVFVLRDAPRESESEIPAGAPAPSVGFKGALVSLFTHRSFLQILPYAILMGAVGPVIQSWMPTYVKEHFSVGQGAAGISATCFQNLPGLVGLLVSGAWADRWGRTHNKGYIYVAVIGCLIATPGILFAAKTGSFAIAMGGLVIYGFGCEFNDATFMPILCQVVDSRYRATAYGAINFVQMITAGLAIYATGALRDLKIETGLILTVAAGIQVLAAVLLLYVKPRQRADISLKEFAPA